MTRRWFPSPALTIVLVLLAVTACAKPSADELDGRLDQLPMPASWEPLGGRLLDAGSGEGQCSALLDPQCPRVHRWYSAPDPRLEVLAQVMELVEEAGFGIEREPSVCDPEGERMCAFTASDGTAALQVLIGTPGAETPEPAEGKLLVEFRLWSDP